MVLWAFVFGPVDPFHYIQPNRIQPNRIILTWSCRHTNLVLSAVLWPHSHPCIPYTHHTYAGEFTYRTKYTQQFYYAASYAGDTVDTQHYKPILFITQHLRSNRSWLRAFQWSGGPYTNLRHSNCGPVGSPTSTAVRPVGHHFITGSCGCVGHTISGAINNIQPAAVHPINYLSICSIDTQENQPKI